MFSQERYLASLMPLQKSVTPWKVGPALGEKSAGGHYCGEALWSPNFDGWYRLRHKEMTQKLELLHLEVICEADLQLWLKDKSEVEIVDLVLKLREKLVGDHLHPHLLALPSSVHMCDACPSRNPPSCPLQTKACRQQLPVKDEVLEKLECRIQMVIGSLPEDLQTVLLRH
ncbi:hypothetical protein Z043_123451 [Scleropages formosus]|uniref:Uncharacterized protein n=1 Tax=Scleropages formosus TaxID=113540 RepID=A0A0P7XZM9_SCLFO|nr:hypothetical protein Z043_123451 [Scleropages formosus]